MDGVPFTSRPCCLVYAAELVDMQPQCRLRSFAGRELLKAKA